MITYYDPIDGKWRIRCPNGDLSPNMFSTEEDALSAIYLAFEILDKFVTQERRYRRASERGQKRLEAEQA